MWEMRRFIKRFFHVHDNLKKLFIYLVSYLKDHIVYDVNPRMFYGSDEVFMVFVSWNHTSRALLRRDAMNINFYVRVA